MYRIGLGGLIHETNTFSQIPALLDNFLNPDGFYPELRRRDEIFKFGEGRYNIPTSGFLHAAGEHGYDIVPLVWCGAEPSAPVTQKVFNELLAMLIDELQAGQPYDAIYLDLHGAMVYGDHQDAETEIIRRVRDVVGDIPIAASLDLHGNISPACFNLATAMVGYRTYPHVDGFETGERAAALISTLLKGAPFYGEFRQLPFLMPSTTQPTTRDPGRAMYAHLEALEGTPGVHSVTLMEGFPPSDLEHTGPSIFAYAETSQLAEAMAERMLSYLLEKEDEFTCDLLPCDVAVDEAIRLTEKVTGPIILADVQDNAGGGSPSDTVWLLDALVHKNVSGSVLGLLYDPQAAAAAHTAGMGNIIDLEVGGHSLPGHEPFLGSFYVESLHEGPFMGTGPMVKDRQIDLGKMACLVIGNVRLVVASIRMQALDQSQFRVVGIEPAHQRILALKSANHYRADFGPIAGGIINVEAPSAIIEDPSKIPYTRLRDGVRLKGLGPVFARPNP